MELLLLAAEGNPDKVLTALSLLSHRLQLRQPDRVSPLNLACFDVVLIDARGDLSSAETLCRSLGETGMGATVIAVLTEETLAAISPHWGVADLLLCSAGPAEIDARLKLSQQHRRRSRADSQVVLGELVLDERAYTATLRSRQLHLSHREFELLAQFARCPGRVFSRAELLAQMWGSGHPGGLRTVDAHVKRLRGKLAPDYEQLICAVRRVGYTMTPPPAGA